MEHLSCDVLVLGSGAAGLRAAIAAREAGLEVCVVSKASRGKATCTWFSAGVIAGSREGDPPQVHRERTLLAGRGINDRALVEALVEDAPKRQRELITWGIRAEMREGYLYAAGRPPVLGEEIVRCLLRRNALLGSRFLDKLTVVDLVAHGGLCGVLARSAASGEWLAIAAKAVVLATGGAAGLYLRHDNPKRMLGDGYRLALAAGATLQDMEFVQFYPLGLAEPGLPAFLIPPKLADCGRLVNSRGENLLEKYGITERPAAERARDRLSQALFSETQLEGKSVLLDLRGLSEADWSVDPFSAAIRQLFGERYGARHRPVRVAPMAHFTMGGVVIDPQGATTVPALFAAGEVTGGLHGANRMGGNALAETLVFGARAGASAAQWAGTADGSAQHALIRRLEDRIEEGQWSFGPSAPEELLEKLRRIMWADGGILRDRYGLSRAAEAIAALEGEGLRVGGSLRAERVARAVEWRSALRCASLVVEGALRREESRGAHCRQDFPDRDDARWLGHLQVRAGSNGRLLWDFAPEPAAP